MKCLSKKSMYKGIIKENEITQRKIKHFQAPLNNNNDDSVLSEISIPKFTKQDLC